MLEIKSKPFEMKIYGQLNELLTVYVVQGGAIPTIRAFGNQDNLRVSAMFQILSICLVVSTPRLASICLFVLRNK